MAAHLLRALVLGVLMVLLFAVPSYAAGLDEANDLIAKETVIESRTEALDAQAGEQVEKALAIDPAGKHAADALPMLAEAQVKLARMTKNMQSVAALWDQVASLGLSEAATAYAGQMKDLAETTVEYMGVTSDILAKYQTLYDSAKVSRLTNAELEKLNQELADLRARSKELDAQVARKQQAGHEYYTDHHLDRASAADGGTWVGLIIGLVIASASAVVCGLVARRKNRNVAGWAIFGSLIPIMALIAIACVRKIDLEPRSAPLLQSRP
jgi:hypothetical protein